MATPDLQNILATLAKYSQPDLQSQQQARLSEANAAQDIQVDYEPPLQPAARPIIDPATITTWQEGLRCVTKIAAQNKNFELTIRKLIRDQRAHEMKWYTERQQLKRTQAKRQQSAAQAKAILQSLASGEALSGASQPDEVDSIAELRELDLQIHKAQKEHEELAVLGLKAIGVPFFGTLPSVIRSEENGYAVSDADDPRITTSELQVLQRRMIEHLEALYKD